MEKDMSMAEKLGNASDDDDEDDEDDDSEEEETVTAKVLSFAWYFVHAGCTQMARIVYIVKHKRQLFAIPSRIMAGWCESGFAFVPDGFPCCISESNLLPMRFLLLISNSHLS